MDATTIVFLLFFAAACVAGFWWLSNWKKRKKQDQGIWSALDELGIPRHRSNFIADQFSPGGLRVTSTVPVSSTALATLDAAIAQGRRRYKNRYPHWNKG